MSNLPENIDKPIWIAGSGAFGMGIIEYLKQHGHKVTYHSFEFLGPFDFETEVTEDAEYEIIEPKQIENK